MNKKIFSYILLTAFLILGFVLRFIFLAKVPQGFNWDEASVGYNAYCLSKTGKDEFGKPWPILIESFGDYKSSLYSFLLIPVIRLMGLTIFAVRLPNVFIGCLTILASFYLALKFFRKVFLAVLVAGLVSISPWEIHVSRYTNEWHLAIPIIIFASALLLEEKNKRFCWPIAAGLFSLSLYLYHSPRLFVPLLFVGFAIIYRKKVYQEKRTFFVSLLLGIIVILPLIKSFVSENWLNRANAVALFTNEALQNELMEGMYRHTLLKLPFTRLFNNKVIFYGIEILDRYLAHFSPQFLFSGEDVTPRIGIDKVGKLYFASLPFIIIGLVTLFKKRTPTSRFLLWWFFLAPLPSSITIDSPHGLRSLLFFPIFQIITISGMNDVYHYFSKYRTKLKYGFVIFTGFMYLMGLSYFLWRYFLFYPEDSASHWQDGYREMVKKLKKHQNNFEKIVISTHYGQPHIFVAFFTPVDPKSYQEMVKNQKPIFNSRIGALGKINFREIRSKDFCLPNTLVITGDSRASNKIPRLEQIFIANRFHKPQLVFEMFDTNEPLVQKEMCAENER